MANLAGDAEMCSVQRQDDPLGLTLEQTLCYLGREGVVVNAGCVDLDPPGQDQKLPSGAC